MKKLFVLFLCFVVGESFASGIGNGATAPCDNATLSKYTGTANVEINWEPNVIQLGWYDGNTKLDVPASAQSCTYDGVVTVPPQPTRPGYTFNGWKVMGVPTGYTRLDYIEGGRQLNAYINLGFPATPTMQTLLTASVSAEYTNDNVMFGACDTRFYAGGGKPYSIDKYPKEVFIPNGDFSYSASTINITISLNTVYQYKINYPTLGVIGVNDITKTSFTNISSVASSNLYVFAGNSPFGDEYSVGKMKLYALTMWDNNQMIHNYIPAKRNSDNTLGIYDTVTGTFLTNAGSGAFVAGPAVQ